MDFHPKTQLSREPTLKSIVSYVTPDPVTESDRGAARREISLQGPQTTA